MAQLLSAFDNKTIDMLKIILPFFLFLSVINLFGQVIEPFPDVDDYEVEQQYEEVYVFVEKMPEFPGGEDSLFTFIYDNLIMPPEINDTLQGNVYVQFVVEKNGNITQIEVIRGLCPTADKEAIRLMKLMPNWIPGEQAGKTVRVRFRLPVKFRVE